MSRKYRPAVPNDISARSHLSMLLEAQVHNPEQVAQYKREAFLRGRRYLIEDRWRVIQGRQ